ncbi:MAG TPA: hypothetical protein VIX73_38500 [Kofleriaceae bacterium]|jgi:hypothetical protein
MAVEIVAKLVCGLPMWRFVPVISACLVACGDNRAGPPDPGIDAGPWTTAAHAPMPTVFQHTGAVLTTMQMVTLTYPGYDATGVLQFGDAMVASSWYQAIGSEYNLASASAVQHKVLPAPAQALTIDAIKQQVIDFITVTSDVVKPTVDKNQVLYLIYVPKNLRPVGLPASLHGYHQMLTATGVQPQGAVKFPIAVVFDDGALSSTTLQAAHQVIDAATNPYDFPNDGWYADPPKTDPWCLLRREIADLCEGETAYRDGDFAFPRAYSNIAAKAGRPPCIPAVAGDSWSDVTAEPSQIQEIPVNGEIKFRLTGWSTSPLPDWKLHVRAAQSSDLSIDEMEPHFAPTDMINNSVTVTLTLRAPPDSAGATGAVEVLSGASQHLWAVAFRVK